MIARRWIVLAALGALVALAPPAGAATFCVSDAACVNGGGIDEGSNLQAALTAAKANAGADTVQIGAGTFSAANGFAESGDPSAITIKGAGRGQTTLTATTASRVVLDVTSSPGSTVEDLTVAMPPSGGIGVDVPAAIRRVTISGGSGGATALWTQNTAVEDVAIDLPLDGSLNFGLYRPNGTLTADGLTIRAHNAINGTGTADAYRHLRIVSDGVGIALGGSGTSMTIDDAQVRMTGSGMALRWFVTLGGAATLNARFLTLKGDGTAGSVGADVTAWNSGSIGRLVLEDAIVTGFDTALSCSEASSGVATLTARWSAFDPTALYSNCATAIDTTTGNLAAEPLLVESPSGDLLPTAASPLIDAGDPALAAPSPATDLAGAARIADGDRDGGARVDVGAFEYVPLAPSVTAGAAPGSVGTGTAATFSVLASSDPNLGDALAYAWSFDDGASAAGTTAQHAFATAGTHTATVTATDPTGLTASSTVAVTVTAPAQPGQPGGQPGGTSNPPVLAVSRFRVAPARFVPVPNGRAGPRRRGAPHRGATFRFGLTRDARVTVRIALLRRGRRPLVRRIVAAGLLAAGDRGLRFDGRDGRGRPLAPGRYRATIVARAGAATATARPVRFIILAP